MPPSVMPPEGAWVRKAQVRLRCPPQMMVPMIQTTAATEEKAQKAVKDTTILPMTFLVRFISYAFELLHQTVADEELRDRVEAEGNHEEEGADEEEHPVMGVPEDDLGHFRADGGRK